MLDNDALGEKGEQRFGEMCAEAGLICNKAGRDRAGWDFVVNFAAPGVGALDKREGALSCYIQVKTILDDTRAAKLKLNMAERLAKELKPAFIVIFKVNTRKLFTGAFLLHVADNRLGAILKRLREEQKNDPACQLNKKSISFAPTESERIDLDGDSLKSALLRYIGGNLSGYIGRKQGSLTKLGFGEYPYLVTAKFQGVTESDVADVFLGLKDKIPNTILQVSETRFDITITEPESVGEISLVSGPHDYCKILYRASPGDIPITFRGDVIAAPPMVRVQKIRIRCPLIDFVIDKTRHHTTINYTFEPNNKKCTALEWMKHWRLALGLLSGSGAIELQLDSSGQSINVKVAPLPIDNLKQLLASARKYLRVSEALLNLCRCAGVDDDLAFSCDEMTSNYHPIMVFDALVSGRQQPVFNVDAHTGSIFLDEKPEATIVAGCFSIENARFVLYGVADVDVDDQASRVLFHNFKYREFRVIPDTDEAYKLFVEDASRNEGIRNYLFLTRVGAAEENSEALPDSSVDVPRLSQ
ncbi:MULTISPECIES: hypothetical protein [Burkholderia]|uniref:DUF4365 domain-containing protein n=1 Tax=Burkholderia pyrrocinia TaxID=60550 RepID=A0A318IX38_BURPY|nr:MULTISPECIES: hypothetical protein [Burkholderia]PXX39070.1 hypothetical protein NA66_1002183 [Burkholderia pyrrocinia]SFW15787.1 hypothetical protein SAMN03159384_00254 [Burkholderia sp. NFACC33-1]SFX07447.1 hypothetical protein SAMN03159408_00255 [Burkholderia sp. NFPP32]